MRSYVLLTGLFFLLSGCSSLVREWTVENQIRDNGVYELEISDDSFIAVKFRPDKDELYFQHYYRQGKTIRVNKFSSHYIISCGEEKCDLSFFNYVKGSGSSLYKLYINADDELEHYNGGKWMKFNFKEE